MLVVLLNPTKAWTNSITLNKPCFARLPLNIINSIVCRCDILTASYFSDELTASEIFFSDFTPETLITASDNALLSAKNKGRNYAAIKKEKDKM